MKFLIATGIYPPEIGGPATVIAELVKDLRARGHDVVVVTYGAKDEIQDGVVRVSRRGSVIARYLAMWRAIRRAISAETVLLTTDVFSVGIPARLALIGKKNRFIIRLGGEWCWEDTVNRGERVTLRAFWSRPDSIRRRLMRWNYRWILGRSTRIMPTSDLLKDIILRIVPAVRDRVVTIPNIFPTRNEQRATGNSPSGPLRLAYVGRFAPVKNIPFLAHALKRLHDEGCAFEATLAGDGLELDEVRTILHDVPEVKFVGRVSPEEGRRILCDSDLHVLPSLSDICPNSVIEALACGVPCVITKEHGLPAGIGGLSEIDPTDEQAWVDVLSRLTADPTVLEALKKDVLSPPSPATLLADVIERI